MLYILDILESIELIEEFIEEFIEVFDYEHFFGDKKTIHAVIDCFNIIGEAVKNLPQDILIKYPKENIGGFARFRDKLLTKKAHINMKLGTSNSFCYFL